MDTRKENNASDLIFWNLTIFTISDVVDEQNGPRSNEEDRLLRSAYNELH